MKNFHLGAQGLVTPHGWLRRLMGSKHARFTLTPPGGLTAPPEFSVLYAYLNNRKCQFNIPGFAKFEGVFFVEEVLREQS